MSWYARRMIRSGFRCQPPQRDDSTWSDEIRSFQPSRFRLRTSSSKRVEDPLKLLSLKTVTRACPNIRIDETRSFIPSGMDSNSLPPATQK